MSSEVDHLADVPQERVPRTCTRLALADDLSTGVFALVWMPLPEDEIRSVEEAPPALAAGAQMQAGTALRVPPERDARLVGGQGGIVRMRLAGSSEDRFEPRALVGA